MIKLAPLDGRPEKVSGRVVVEDQQGGLLLEDSAGVYWTLEAKDVQSKEVGAEEFKRVAAGELGAALKGVVGGNAAVITTKHYVIVSRAGRAYTNWCGSLLERLRTGFLAHWEREKVPLSPGDAPLAVVVFQNKSQFAEYAIRDGAAVAVETFGYYSARTNRVALYDLSADETAGALGDAASRDEVTRRLSKFPASVATVVHEAVHQLAFNTGLQVRYADNPMWVSEGLAMYFETPDFGTGTRWTTAGLANPWRVREFQAAAANRPADAVTSLVRSDERFQDAGTAPGAYAESWALVHFLATKRRGEWDAYVKSLRDRGPLVFDSPEERLAGFKNAFGDDLAGLERTVSEHVRGLKVRR